MNISTEYRYIKVASVVTSVFQVILFLLVTAELGIYTERYYWITVQCSTLLSNCYFQPLMFSVLSHREFNYSHCLLGLPRWLSR